MKRKQKPKKRIRIVGIVIIILIAIGVVQNNTKTGTTRSDTVSKESTSVEVTEKVTPEVIKVEVLPTTVDESEYHDLNIVIPDVTSAPIGSSMESDVLELASSDTDVQETQEPIAMPFYDASDLKGRGLRDTGAEPNYVDAIGYAAVYMEAGLENNAMACSTPWTVPIYKKINGVFIPDGTISHKTKIGIISQELTKQNGREYQGYLEFQNIETGSVGYINVKNFVTSPYWELEVSKAVDKGYNIALFKQTSQYIPSDKNGDSVIVKNDTRVLLPATGTYYISIMDKINYQILGIVFDNEDPQYVFFNKTDLTLVY